MDAITAVALAGNILQFIEFAGGLFNDARKLYASATGTSDTVNHFQDICNMPIQFHTELQKSSTPSTCPTGNASKHGIPLAACAAACRRDCEDLLDITNKLKIIGTKGKRCWSSFRVALTEVRKKSEIEDLRSRIADRQSQIILLLCAASNERIKELGTHVMDICRGIWRLRTDSRLDVIITEVNSLRGRIREQERNKNATAADITNICNDLSKLSLEARDLEKEANVLSSLNYKDRPKRHEMIPMACGKTFEWSLKQSDSTTEAKLSRLRNWLRADDALFWVSGKPGSGKSTFMKYIADNKETKQYLKEWAAKHELIIISHYFTIYGSPIQRSLNGLLRSLVFGILVQKPSLIAKVLKDRWNLSTEQPKWTQTELEAVLRSVGTETDSMPCKMCFFIDGLDEYEGDHMDICQTLKQLSRSPFIKVCIASRPWNVFEDALGNRPDAKIYIHELTRKDIHYYTAHRLQEHPRRSVLQNEAGSITSSLIDEIVSKSNGVFLWVTLVVKQLREGFTNDDSLGDLQRRLSSYPADLEKFFEHILSTIDPFYNEKMAESLLLTLHAEKPLRLEIFYCHDMEFDDEDYALKEPTRLMPTNNAELRKLHDLVSRRINGRCKGLLERNGTRIVFLHRTVYDFLRTDEMTRSLNKHAKSHNHHLSLLKAFLAWIKRSTFQYYDMQNIGCSIVETPDFLTEVEDALAYAHLAEKQSERSAVLAAMLLDNMECSIPRMLDNGQLKLTKPYLTIDMFRKRLLDAGVGNYVCKKLDMDIKFFNGPYADQLTSPLDELLSRSCKFADKDRYYVIQKLLQGGCDPKWISVDNSDIENKWEFDSP